MRDFESLRAGLSRDRIPVEVNFSTPVQTALGTHPDSYTMGTGVSFPAIKLTGRGLNHPLSPSVEIKERA